MPNLPPKLTRMSRFPHRLLALGVPMGPLKLLRTKGRRTGKPHTIPVVTFRHDQTEWLVSPFGETAWVHNARTDGHATLGRGTRMREVCLAEIEDPRKPEILYHYRRRYRIIPFVRQAFKATPKEGKAPFEKESNDHPVFVVQPRD